MKYSWTAVGLPRASWRREHSEGVLSYQYRDGVGWKAMSEAVLVKLGRFMKSHGAISGVQRGHEPALQRRFSDQSRYTVHGERRSSVAEPRQTDLGAFSGKEFGGRQRHGLLPPGGAGVKGLGWDGRRYRGGVPLFAAWAKARIDNGAWFFIDGTLAAGDY
jgi:hypothetical protein